MAIVGSPIITNITAAPVPIYSPSPSGISHVSVFNNGPATVYVGAAGVTSAAGIPVAPGNSVKLVVAGTALYAVSGYTPTATTTTIATTPVAHGTAVATTVASGAGTANGQYVVVGAGSSAETTTITAGGGTTALTLAQLQGDHLVGAPVTVVTPQPTTISVTAGAS